jgi:hypothetical protein
MVEQRLGLRRETGARPIVITKDQHKRLKAAGVAMIDDPRYYIVQRPMTIGALERFQQVGTMLGRRVIVDCLNRTVNIGETVNVPVDHKSLAGSTVYQACKEAIFNYHAALTAPPRKGRAKR